MTHFIGAVIVPADVHTDFVRTPTAFPDLYGKNALETDPTESLSAYLAKALAPFDESREVEYYKSKADIIAEKRAEIEAFEQGTYAQYLKNPEEYRRDILSSPVPNLRHLAYLEEEFPKQLKWSDEEVYQGALKFEEASNVRQSDGAVRQTYNPLSKWDWWTIGGRWEEMYRERQGQKVSELLPIVEQALADVRDPANIAELAEVMEYIETVRQQFREQQKRTQAWYAENPDKRSNDVDENFRLANSGVVEKVITYHAAVGQEARLQGLPAVVVPVPAGHPEARGLHQR